LKPDEIKRLYDTGYAAEYEEKFFVPLADPELITGHALPYRLNSGEFAGNVTLTGIMWSFSEQDGKKVHSNLVTPHPDFMVESFERCFEDVTLIRYPLHFRAGPAVRRSLREKNA
jgi:hypothetical protein